MKTTKLRGFTLFILLCGLFCPVSVDAEQGRFSVTLNGYLANQQTNEGVTLDESGDELTLVSNVGTVDSSGRLTRLIWGTSFTSIMNGLQTGGCYPLTNPCEPWRRNLPTANANPPTVLFEGDIVQNGNAALIIPTIWEWDGVNYGGLMRLYADQIDRDQNNLTSEVARMIRNPSSLELDKYLRPGAGMRINNTVTLTGGLPQNRPIGMQVATGFNQFGFTPQVLVLTFQAANFISRTNFGRGIGVVPVNYVDASLMGGNYTLFLQVERTDEVPPCPSNITSTFTGRAVMTISNPSKQMPRVFTQDISFPVEFTDCRTALRITNFPSIIPPEYQTPLGPNTTTVNLSGGGTGTFNPVSGGVEISLTLGFLNSNRALGNSTLPLRLTTQPAQGGGKKDLNNGSLTLVGEGAFSGGYLGTSGSRASLAVTGSFDPRPRP